MTPWLCIIEYTRISQILYRVFQNQVPHYRQPPLPIIEQMSRRGKDRCAISQCNKFWAPAKRDCCTAVADTTSRKHLRRWRRDTETQVLGEVDDGLRQFAVARLEQFLEQANALFDGDLEDVADQPAMNTQHRVYADACYSSQLDQRQPVDSCL